MAHEAMGPGLSLLWGLPFAGLLLSIAFVPLVAPAFWHEHFGKISAAWALAFLAPFTIAYGPSLAVFELLHVLLLEYVPFIVLLLALYTAGGGVRIRGRLGGTPLGNTGVLAIGAVLAGWIGTTGACMLLIHAVLRANSWRKHRTHIVVFFIFIVGNIGGSLSPLGDPPLFIGFLKGIDFFWPTTHLFLPMLLCLAILLPLFWGLDYWLMRRDHDQPPRGPDDLLSLDGAVNLVLIALMVGAVLLSGVWHPDRDLMITGVHLPLEDIARTLLLLVLTGLSLRLTDPAVREANAFHWFPIVEVAKLFAGIFVTIVPVIAILQAGKEGAAAPLIALLSEGGEPRDEIYFWMTGVLSAFLDNAPTYLVFFNIAGGDPQLLMGKLATTLTAISCGAVFMGAVTYIGNAPNFMVKAIAEDHGIAMPSFFAFVGWACLALLPIFGLVTLVFFR